MRVPFAVLPDGELPLLPKRRRVWDLRVGRVREADLFSRETTAGFASMGVVVNLGRRNVLRCIGFGLSHGWRVGASGFVCVSCFAQGERVFFFSYIFRRLPPVQLNWWLTLASDDLGWTD